MAGRQKSLVGTVVSDRMAKTVIVAVETTTRHRLYHKIFKRTKRYMAHDDRLGAKPGDQVRILETRPLSRHKRWRVAEVVQRGEVAEIAPREIDTQYLSITREREAPPAPAAAAPVDVPEVPEAGTAAGETTPAAEEAAAPAPDAPEVRAPEETGESEEP